MGQKLSCHHISPACCGIIFIADGDRAMTIGRRSVPQNHPALSRKKFACDMTATSGGGFKNAPWDVLSRRRKALYTDCAFTYMQI